MNGGHFASFKQSFKLRLLLGILFTGLIVGSVTYILSARTNLDPIILFSIILAVCILISIILGGVLTRILTKPTEIISQAIYHVSPNQHMIAAPNIDTLSFGKELAENLIRQIYDYAAIGQTIPSNTQSTQSTDAFLDQIPVGIIGLDKAGNIQLINKTVIDTFGLNNPTGIALEKQLEIKFINESLSDWVSKSTGQSINNNTTWHKVEIGSIDGEKRSYYDIAATYRQGHASGIEVIMALFEHSDLFEIEEETLNLIALTVHEIRTPLTIVRGYIDALNEELAGKLNAQDKEDFRRLRTASQNLSTFMSNVLNVVKADQNQLHLNLTEQNWQKSLTTIVENLRDRASVRGKEIILNIPDNLPSVALDRLSINEVITNLLDNSIKYSPANAPKIAIDVVLDKDGTILTTVQDEGVGIPDTVIPTLFNRFHRNHRNSKAITGTGLGLYISKAIVSAHHGNIWIKSHEGQGTTVGFTLIPYSKLAEVADSQDNTTKPITHGWIKNHSMQRR